jgi:hypothetical protein
VTKDQQQPGNTNDDDADYDEERDLADIARLRKLNKKLLKKEAKLKKKLTTMRLVKDDIRRENQRAMIDEKENELS